MTEYDNFKYGNYNYDNYDNYHNNSYFIKTQSITPFLGIFFILFLSICLSCIPPNRSVNELNRNIIISEVNRNLLNELPIIIIKNMNEGVCSICLENFIINDEVNKLSCNHMFHKKCLDGWIHNNNCPLCRNIII